MRSRDSERRCVTVVLVKSRGASAFSRVSLCKRLFVVAPLVVVACALVMCDVPEMSVRRARVASRASSFVCTPCVHAGTLRAFTCGI